MNATDNQMVRKRLGKWGRDTMSHFGWAVDAVIDLGSKKEKCEMCEQAWIRFQYLVTHPKHGPLKVGCDCGGWMIGDTARAGRDIRDMRNSAARRLRAAKRKAEEDRIAAEAAAAQAERERIAAMSKAQLRRMEAAARAVEAERARTAAVAAGWAVYVQAGGTLDPDDLRRRLSCAQK
jgi:hypothetical protein